MTAKTSVNRRRGPPVTNREGKSMSSQCLKEKLAAGGTAVGTFLAYVTNPAVVDVFPDDGLDFVILNTEHTALNMSDFHGLQYAFRTKGIACLMRVHNRDPEDVAKACDAFPDGVVVPYVEDVDELRHLVAAAKYRPLKGPAIEKIIKTGQFPSDKTREYVEQKCGGTFFCAMIESVTALENLDAICAVPGIDAVLVGPNDLSVSMGIPEERDNPEFIAAVQQIIDTAARHGIAAGAHYSRIEHAQRLIRQGARFIPYASDLRFIQHGLAETLIELRGTIADDEQPVI